MNNLKGTRKSKQPHPWSPEEDAYLECVFNTPNLHKYWNKIAQKNGWPIRGEQSLKHRIIILNQSRRTFDESNGWLFASQLLNYLGYCQNNSQCIHRWEQKGLRTYRENSSPCSPIKVHLADFVKWVLNSPEAIAEVSKATDGDRVATAWLLRQIADWRNEKNPAANYMRPSPGKRQRSAE